MKDRKKKSVGFWLLAIGSCLLIAIGFIAYLLYNKATTNSIALVTDDTIDVTPQQIRAMRAIGQWEFLSITDEEMVDTVRRGIFFDDQLVRIYYGTLRLGIDMEQLRDDAFRAENDTLNVTLPPIGLLDSNFIDEAHTRSFISNGTWSSSDREALYQRARQKMLRQCLTKQNITRAQENAEQQIGNMLRSMGFAHVKINFSNTTAQ
jgi:hypothetical protein